MRAEARRLYGMDPEGYEAGRPEYPERIYEVLVERCGVKPGTAVVEIGAGTGRVTRRLVALGARVVAVEPDSVLAAGLAQATADGTVQVVGTSFEQARLAEGAFDVAVAATSFHWVDQDLGMPKLGRVLRPGGWAALWWTVFGDPDRADPFRDATKDLLAETRGPPGGPDRPQFELDVAERTSDLGSRAGLVGAGAELIRWTARLDPPQVRRLYGSMIAILRRPEAERRRLLDGLVAIATDEFGGVVERPFVTAIYTARRP
jgi:SAM-dependent methyltransferase